MQSTAESHLGLRVATPVALHGETGAGARCPTRLTALHIPSLRRDRVGPQIEEALHIASDRIGIAQDLALPGHVGSPPVLVKCQNNVLVTLDGLSERTNPSKAICSGGSGLGAVQVTMPKAAMDEDGRPRFTKDDVRSPRQLTNVPTHVGQAQLVKGINKKYLRPCVRGPHSNHPPSHARRGQRGPQRIREGKERHCRSIAISLLVKEAPLG